MSPSQNQGMYFEEFVIGQTMASPARTVTETDVVQFAGLSGDYNPIHTDTAFSQNTPFGQRIAHGLLGLSIASGLATRAGFIESTVIAFLGLSWKFKNPVFIGDTIHMSARVARMRAMPSMGGGMVTMEITVINQRGETAQEGEWNLLIKSRPTA